MLHFLNTDHVSRPINSYGGLLASICKNTATWTRFEFSINLSFTAQECLKTTITQSHRQASQASNACVYARASTYQNFNNHRNSANISRFRRWGWVLAWAQAHDKHQFKSNNQPIPNANEYLLISIANKKWATGFRSKLLIWFIHAVQINRHASSSQKISVSLSHLLFRFLRFCTLQMQLQRIDWILWQHFNSVLKIYSVQLE